MHWFPLEFFYLLIFSAGIKSVLDIWGSSFCIIYFCFIRLAPFLESIWFFGFPGIIIIIITTTTTTTTTTTNNNNNNNNNNGSMGVPL